MGIDITKEKLVVARADREDFFLQDWAPFFLMEIIRSH